MIISERQIYQLMAIAAECRTIISPLTSTNESSKDLFDAIGRLLNNISSQQSEELKVIE